MFTKEKEIIKYVLLIGLLFLSGCGEIKEVSAIDDEKTIAEDNNLLYITELDTITEFTKPIYIDLEGLDESLIIEKGGEYVLSGGTHYPVKIDVHDEIVQLFLDNISIESAVGPAIEIVSGGKVIVTLMEDTSNSLLGAAYYSNEEVSGVISSTCDLTINGEGALYVCGYYKDAVYTKDVFKLLGGTVQLKAKRNGIKGNDGIVLAPENLMIESEKNGCQTSNANKVGKGVIDIQGGEISVVAGEYGLSAVSDIYIRDGQVYLNSVIADIYTEGQQYIAEGTLIDE